jgi:hypothetical protein
MGEVGEAVKRMESVSHSLSHTLPTHFTNRKPPAPTKSLVAPCERAASPPPHPRASPPRISPPPPPSLLSLCRSPRFHVLHY